MEKRTVTLKFEGDFDGVSIDTFTGSMLGYARTLQAAAEEISPDVLLDVNITATRPGCLEAILQTVVRDLPGLLATVSQTSEQLLPIIDGVNGYLQLRKFLGENGAPRAIERRGDGIVVTAGNKSQITINQTILNLGNSDAVDAAAGSMFSALENDEQIKGMTLSQNGGKGFSASSDEFPSIATAPRCALNDERVKIEKKVYLSVTKPMLEVSDKRKWEFYWHGQKITGFMGDFDFLNKLLNHEYTFGIGDVLLADLELTQKKNAQNVWANKKIRVVKVYDVIAQPEDERLL